MVNAVCIFSVPQSEGMALGSVVYCTYFKHARVISELLVPQVTVKFNIAWWHHSCVDRGGRYLIWNEELNKTIVHKMQMSVKIKALGLSGPPSNAVFKINTNVLILHDNILVVTFFGSQPSQHESNFFSVLLLLCFLTLISMQHQCKMLKV